MQDQNVNITNNIFEPTPIVTETQNRVSVLCDQLLVVTPSPCARELIFQIRSEAGCGKLTLSGSLQGRDR